MAGLRKLKGKFYARINYIVDGKRKEKLIPLHTKQEAKARRLLPDIEQREKLFKSGVIGIEQITGNEIPKNQPLIDEFIEYKKLEQNISDKTIILYNYALDTFMEIFQGRNIRLLQKQDYKRFLEQMRIKYPNSNTINIRLRSIKSFLNWMVESGVIEKVPFKIKSISVQKKQPKYFSDKEMNIILDNCKNQPELYARIYVHLKTGLRLRELNNSYYENGYIRTFNPVKHGLERAIPINDTTEFYYTWLKENSKYRAGTISKKFMELLKELNLYKTKSGDKRKFHNLRDSFAIRTYYQTRDIYKVSKLLGHSSVTTTEIYAGFDMELLEKDFGTNESNQEQQSIEIQPKAKIKNYNNMQDNFVDNFGVKYAS